MYPGGAHLDRLVGPKTDPEPGWHYPEAWIFSPSPAINPGSTRTTEGQTLICDATGRAWAWDTFLAENGEPVLAGGSLDLCVKLLDGACTLPKEFHFRPEDEPRLRSFPGLKDFAGVLIKPEAWIRHPSAGDEASPSYAGFREPFSREKLRMLVREGVPAMEAAMNRVIIAPGEALYLPGGLVHSLGKGLYFEVLASGDLKITLQESFAGKELTPEVRYPGIYREGTDNLGQALEFVDCTHWGDDVLSRYYRKPVEIEPGRESIVDTPFFSADWLRVEPGEMRTWENDGPGILVAASGSGRLTVADALCTLQTRATTFEEFGRKQACYAVIMHGDTSEFSLQNEGTRPLVLLSAGSGRGCPGPGSNGKDALNR